MSASVARIACVMLLAAIAPIVRTQTPEQYYQLGVDLRRSGDVAEALGHLRMALDLRPDFPDAHAEIGALYMSMGRREDAEEHLVRARARDPGLVRATVNLARLHAAQDEHGTALPLYQEAVSRRPDLAPAHLGAALCLQALRRYDEAIAAYTRALDLEPRQAAALANMASCHEAVGDDDGAINIYLRALQVDPASSMALGNLGAICRARGMPVESRSLLSQAVAADPAFTMARYNLALTLLDGREYDQAAGHLERVIVERPEHVGARYNLGRAYFRLRRVEDGQREMAAYQRLTAIAEELQVKEAAVVMQPGSAVKQYELGATYEKHDRREQAREAYQRAVRLDADHADAHYRLGILALRMGAPDESERRHRRAVTLAPNSVGPRLGLAAALMAQGDLDGALAEYSGALLLDGHNATALAGSGSVHFQREQWANAESNYRAALDAHPEAHWAMDGLARTCLARGGDAQEALELAKAAYALAATPRYLETAAFAYVAMSDRESARIAATTAVRMDPENPSYRATLRRINEMRGNE